MPSHKHRALLDEHVQHSSGWRSYTPYLGEVQENYLGGSLFRASPTRLLVMLFFHPSSTSFANLALTLGRLLGDTFSQPSCRAIIEQLSGAATRVQVDCGLTVGGTSFRQLRISKTNAFRRNRVRFCHDSRALSVYAAIRILRNIVRACARTTHLQIWSRLLRL